MWNRVEKSALSLKNGDQLVYKTLLDQYDVANQYMKSIVETDLVPSHGDAHIGNLFPTSKGWLWMDFEDVSLMPRYWDLASVVANLVLFKGLEIPLVQAIINDKGLVTDKQEFYMVLNARVLMSIIGNLDMALQGLGDLEYANLQLSKFEQYLSLYL